jgi:CheY-like chemotaxis protein
LSKVPLVSIIDDNDSVGWAVAGVIGSAGCSVLVFPSAEEFIQSDQMPNTACLVVDAQLPGMSGLQLQSHLAAAGRHIPIIFIAASADNGTQGTGARAGSSKRSGQGIRRQSFAQRDPLDLETLGLGRADELSRAGAITAFMAVRKRSVSTVARHAKSGERPRRSHLGKSLFVKPNTRKETIMPLRYVLIILLAKIVRCAFEGERPPGVLVPCTP